MDVQPYLFFNGRCEEALDFYKKKLGAEVSMMMRFKESPDKESVPKVAGAENKIMHASFKVGAHGLMASDGMCQGAPSFQGFALSLGVPDAAAADKTFTALSDGGQVQMPLTQTFFSPRFGMVTDKFGVSWMVIVEPKH
jgi:PhnB protein